MRRLQNFQHASHEVTAYRGSILALRYRTIVPKSHSYRTMPQTMLQVPLNKELNWRSLMLADIIVSNRYRIVVGKNLMLFKRLLLCYRTRGIHLSCHTQADN